MRSSNRCQAHDFIFRVEQVLYECITKHTNLYQLKEICS